MEYISIIVTGGNEDARKRMVDSLIAENNINKFDVTEVEKVKPSTAKQKVLGIEDIRNAQSNIYLAPIKGTNKAVILSCEDITAEAQNALLKILEEPPNNTLLVISIPTVQKLLPTILSRCKVITVKDTKNTKNNVQTADILQLIQASIGEKLKKAEIVGKDKETALAYLLDTIKTLRKDLYETVLEEKSEKLDLETYHTLLSKLNATYTTIATTNVNPRFALEIVLLSLQKK